MKGILTIIKKELKRFFTDKRMLASLIMPGIIIFVLYYAMGTFIPKLAEVDQDYTYKVYAINEPESFKAAFNNINIEYLNPDDKSIDDLKDDVKNEEADLVVIYNGDFIGFTGETKPNVEVFYNSVKKESASVSQIYTQVLTQIEGSLNEPVFEIKAGLSHDLASEKEKTGMIISSLLPYLLVVMLFSGCMAIVPESIAGEKERGTIATLLVTPLKRTSLAVGKIVSLSIVSLCSALSTFIGLALSIPKLMQMNQAMGLTLSYTPIDYLYIILILISTVLLFVAILSLISAYSKSIKEATSYASPVMIIVVAVGMLSMFGITAKNDALFMIPFYNVAMCLTGILSFEATGISVLITVLSNLVYSVLLGFALSKMFNSERIMFNS